MEQLISNNPNCVDCEDPNITGVNMQLGVFLCEKCSLVHQKQLKMLIRNLDDQFLDEEINFLSHKGNSKINSNLLKNVMPWTVSLKQNNFPQVREWMAEAKYIHQVFAREAHRRQQTHDLSKSWYYLDEVTREISRIRGPYPRQAIKKLLDEEQYLFKDSLVWHPALGVKWKLVERVLDIINPRSSLSDQALNDAFMKKLSLQSYTHPHLKGYLDVSFKGFSGKKWVVILDRHVNVYTSNVLIGNFEVSMNIEEVNVSLIQHDSRIAIKIEDSDVCLLSAAKVDEVIEWFHAICCCRHLVFALGNDFPPLEVDYSELHICNVKSSDEYLGEKIHEGLMRKSGQRIKSQRARWFILRTNALFSYLNKNDKQYKNLLKLTPNTVVSCLSDQKLPNHLSLVNPERTLNMWADSAAERDAWVNKLEQTLESIKNKERESATYTW